jgi:hypothetical protein
MVEIDWDSLVHREAIRRVQQLRQLRCASCSRSRKSVEI